MCLAADGASVFSGQKSGVITKIQKDYPQVLYNQDMNHNLALATRTALLKTTVAKKWMVMSKHCVHILAHRPHYQTNY